MLFDDPREEKRETAESCSVAAVVAISLFGTPLVVHADKTVVRIAHKYDELNVWHRAFEAVKKPLKRGIRISTYRLRQGGPRTSSRSALSPGAPDVYVVGDIPAGE